MTKVASHSVPGTVDEAWAVVSDPWTYPSWLVGAKEIRSVDDGWPAAGTEFRHRVGLGGPIVVADTTQSEEVEAPRRLVLIARARPFGRARVEITVHDDSGGTRVEMREGPIGAMAPTSPLAQPLILARNRRSLRQLAQHLAGER